MYSLEEAEKRHKESVGRYNRVTDFARLCYYNFMKDKKHVKVLDLGCGKGADTIFFHNKGLDATGVDYSTEAIKQFNDTQKRYDIFVTSLMHDISKKLPFEADSYDFVYSRLSLHYFKDKKTRKIIYEIKRVLKPNGLFMFQVKSISSKEYGIGKEIEKDIFQDDTGYIRHLFSKEYTESILEGFNIVMLEERKIHQGSAYLEVISEKK